MEIRAIQRSGDTIAASGTSKDTTITAVVLARSRLVWNGHDGNLNDSTETAIRLELFNATTVRATRFVGGSEARAYTFEVVEEWPVR